MSWSRFVALITVLMVLGLSQAACEQVQPTSSEENYAIGNDSATVAAEGEFMTE